MASIEMIMNQFIQPVKPVVVHEAARRPSNWRMQMSFDEFLKAKNIPGITGVDTRAITKIVREHGTMKALTCTSKR